MPYLLRIFIRYIRLAIKILSFLQTLIGNNLQLKCFIPDNQ